MPPPFSPLDAAQCVRGAFEDATGRFRVDAIATVIGGDITVEMDGIYNPITNPLPDNAGLIAAIRAISPTLADQVNQITSITNGDVHALDVSIHNSDGSDIDASTPLSVTITNTSIPVTQSGVWSVGRTWTLDSATDSVTSFQGGLWDVSVNNFPATQPISGTVTANQGTTPWVVSATDLDIRDLIHTQDSVRLGDGINFLTSTTVGPDVGLDVYILNTLTISGTVAVSDNAGDYAATSVLTQVARTNASTVLKASNPSRRGLILVNDSSAVCYVSFAGTSSSTAYTFRMTNNEVVSLDKNPIYTGTVSGIWASNGSGSMMVTELT